MMNSQTMVWRPAARKRASSLMASQKKSYHTGGRPGNESSKPGEFHPEFLTEPCVNLSILTALAVQPLAPTTAQRAKSYGAALRTRESHRSDSTRRRRSLFYLLIAHPDAAWRRMRQPQPTGCRGVIRIDAKTSRMIFMPNMPHIIKKNINKLWIFDLLLMLF
jgi:hypothetical protein